MPGVEVGQTYHHRRVKDARCVTYLAVTREGGKSTDYMLWSETQPTIMRRHLSPQSWHVVEECPYG